MARFIEREKFIKKCTETFGHFGVLVKAIEEISDECTTADVVPKTEVAREIFAEIENAHEECIHIDPSTNIGYLLQSKFEHKLAELKKKYVGETND